VMDKGKVMQFGTPEEIYNDPSNFFTASFVGSPQINYYNCVVKDQKIIIEDVLEINKFNDIPEGRYIMAIRPEKIVVRDEILNSVKLNGKVLFSDNLGSQFLINVSVNGLVFRCILKEKIQKNVEVEIFIPKNSVFWFGQDGQRVQF
ncbi:MAG: hypothetical protein N2169_07260, partial [bacterium]|nr:hypothetical protein [bacterium]